MPNELIVRNYIERCEEEYKGDPLYTQYSKKMAQVPLDEVTLVEVQQIIEPYLYRWGRMGRVLGRKRYQGWQSNLAKQIRSNGNNLRDFRSMYLAKVDLAKSKAQIESLYGTFKDVVGGVAAAKILHLLCPDFFPIWDNGIEEAVWGEKIKIKGERQVMEVSVDERLVEKFQKILERYKSKQERKPKRFSAQDYFRFMAATQDFLQKYDNVLSELATRYQKGILKIADECFLWGTRRPLHLFF